VASQVPRSLPFYLYLYLRGNLKGKVYKNNPCSIEALQNEIIRVIGSITMDELQKVSHNLQAKGGHFQHLLQSAFKFVLSFYSILINVCIYRN
jgi:hypothetical protein